MIYIHDADIIKVTWEDSRSHCKCFQRRWLRPHKAWKQAAEFQLSYSLWEDILQSHRIVKALLEPALRTAEMKSHWCGSSESIFQFFCFGWFFFPNKSIYCSKQDNRKNQGLIIMDCVSICCDCFSFHYSFQLCLISLHISGPFWWPIRSTLPCQTLSHQLIYRAERISLSPFSAQKSRVGSDWPSLSHKPFSEAISVSGEI